MFTPLPLQPRNWAVLLLLGSAAVSACVFVAAYSEQLHRHYLLNTLARYEAGSVSGGRLPFKDRSDVRPRDASDLLDGARMRELLSAFPSAAAQRELARTITEHPNDAAQLACTLCDEQPARASEWMPFLLRALDDAGKFDTAIACATHIGDTSLRTYTVRMVLERWGECDPDAARQAARSINDGPPEVRLAMRFDDVQ
jgi:hypothetical protein